MTPLGMAQIPLDISGVLRTEEETSSAEEQEQETEHVEKKKVPPSSWIEGGGVTSGCGDTSSWV